jgi:hypothetical protein
MDPAAKDRHYWRNVTGISAVEFLWGLGLPVVVESTFLQLFLRSRGASGFALGMIPIFFFVGTSVFALLSSYLTENLVFKRRAVIWLHVLSGASLLLFGAVLYLLEEADHVLPIFFACYAVFSVCVGMTLPVWLNYLVKIFSENRSVSGLAYMMIAQNVAKLISSLVILKLVERYAFAREASALVFLTVGTLFCIGALFFLLTREHGSGEISGEALRPPFREFFGRSWRHMMANRNFLTFLAGDLEFYVVVTVISFYAAYATEYGGVSPAAAAGLFVGLIYAGSILVNILLGTMGWFSLKTKALVSKVCSLAAVVLMASWPTPVTFYTASYLLGTARGIRMLVFAPAVKKLCGLQDATAYFAVAPLLTLPFATGLPLVCGRFLDRFAWLQADAFRLVFLVAALLLTGTFFCTLKADFSGRRRVAPLTGVHDGAVQGQGRHP